MSLNWDISRIANRETVCRETVDGERRLKAVTEALIFGTMTVGIGEITEKNLPEWEFRFEVLNRVGVKLLARTVNGKGEGYNPSPEDIRAHVGLRTNVFPMERRPSWLKRIMGGIARDAEYAIRNR